MKTIKKLAMGLLMALLPSMAWSQRILECNNATPGNMFAGVDWSQNDLLACTGVKVKGQIKLSDLENLRYYMTLDREEMTGGPIPYVYMYELDLGEATLVEEEIPDSMFAGTFIKRIILPPNIKRIGRKAFQYSDLHEIDIPEGVVSIGEEAFGYCRQLERVHLPDGLEEISKSLFYRCMSLSQLNIPSRLKKLGAGAFADCNALPPSAFDFPNTLEYLGAAFWFNGGLTELVVPENVTYFGGIGWNDYIKRVEFKTDKLTEIGDHAFTECYKLKEVILGEGIKSIGYESFYCVPITSINLPNTVELIDQAAFTFCEFDSLMLPRSLKTIGYCAFDCCSKLRKLYVPCTEPPVIGSSGSWHGHPFSDVPTDLVTLYIPRGTTQAYAQSEIFKVFTHVVELDDEDWPSGAIDVAQDRPAITVTGGTLSVTPATATTVEVIDLQGRIVASQSTNGTVTLSLTPGIYIVRCGTATTKVQI